MLTHWAFDDGLTNPNTRTAVDSVNSNDATFTNNLVVPGAWKSGSAAKVGGAIELDGNDTSNALFGSELTSPARGITISTWIKLDELPTSMSTNYGSIYDSTADSYVLYLDKYHQELRMKVTANAVAYPGIPQSMLDTSSWHYVTGVYDSGAGIAKIYLDGQMIDVECAADGSPLFGSPTPCCQ